MIRELLQRGIELHQSGRIAEAKGFYEQALKLSPRNADALHLLGVASLQEGAPEDAVKLIRKAVARQPANGAFHGNLAHALFASGDFAEALTAFRRAAAMAPGEPQFRLGVANCHAACGRYAEAEAEFRAITGRFPGFALGWFNLGNVLRDQGRHADAAEPYRRAIQADPQLADAHNNLGGVLHSSKALGEAEAAYRRALALAPESTTYLCNLASVLLDRGRVAEAESVSRRAVALNPEAECAHTILGTALGQQGRVREALECQRRALVLKPGDARGHLAVACALCALGRHDEGLPHFERALALEPESDDVHVALSAALLARSNLRAGWSEYRHRPARARLIARHPGVPLSSSLPETLNGKQVCVLAEQGLGDQLFFLRFAGELKARGAQVKFCCSAKLAGMVARVPVIDRVIVDGEPIPAADHIVCAGDLPLALAADAKAAPYPPPLPLTPLPAQLDAMRERLAALGPPPYFALTWRAGVAPEAQGPAATLSKQIPPAELAAALRGVDATLLAVQRHPAGGEIGLLADALGKPLHDLTALNEDLEAMLALLALIDDYVGVSNTNMHLRAGVGRTARVLVPCPAEWRWMAQGGESPWFPGFAIYRQTGDGDWSAAIAELRRDFFQQHGEGRSSPP